ncbi:hypothetical protein BJ742DRAFT_579455 [Cladochytrium replicatum]|nr:hypothetical protein BJ742DRAFT_579455 [Cladochytrium replicatum]
MDALEQFRLARAPEGCTIYYIPEFVSQSAEFDEQDHLLRKVYAAPKVKWTQLKRRRLQSWGASPIYTKEERDEGIAPNLTPKNTIAIDEKMPEWLDRLGGRLADLGVFNGTEGCDPADGQQSLSTSSSGSTPVPKRIVPNNCLINEYEPSQGIMPHFDGPAYLTAVATVSLGGPCMLEFYHPKTHPDAPNAPTRPEFGVYVEPRSLLILRDGAYTRYLHGISETTMDVLDREFVINFDECGIASRGHSKKDDNTLVEVLRETTRVSLTFRRTKRVAKTNVMSLLGKRK